MTEYRTEHDTMGEVRIPKDAYYGAQTQRAIENFPVSGKPLPPEFIRAYALLKKCAAVANDELGRFAVGATNHPLSDKQVEAMVQAAGEIASNKLADQFPVDVFQTGSGTSTNMSLNEVIAVRATEILTGERELQSDGIHPNEHPNLGQSTNDTFPTATHIAAGNAIARSLVPALVELQLTLEAKAEAFAEIAKIGRTHLADATPLTLGNEFGGFSRQAALAVDRANEAINALLELPVGGTAVGSGINTHPEFAGRICKQLHDELGIPFREAENHYEANANRDGIVAAHAHLKTIATSLFSIANNLRWLGSGPRCGFYEIQIPDLQPGSSIMPGKVNPVLCESLMQVTAKVIGNDQTVTFAGASGGQFQLNIMMPLLADVLLESIRILASGVQIFTDKCVTGIEANRERCEAMIEQSLAMVTTLNPIIGYEKAAEIAKKAFAEGKTIREVCLEEEIVSPEILEQALNPMGKDASS